MEKGMRITDFADAINCSRRNVYHIFNRKRINKQQLQKVSQVLKFDFATLYQETDTLTKKFLVMIEVDEKQLSEIKSKYQVVYLRNV